MRSNASVINEQGLLIVLIVPLVLPPLAAVLLVRLDKANTVSSVKQVVTSQSMQVSSWLQVKRRLPPLAFRQILSQA